MIRFAQNFEDVILERIFKDKKKGFYIDIGACHPVDGSITHRFYSRGWSGVNLEPQPDLFDQLQRVRERDINLQVCVGAKAGSGVLVVTPGISIVTPSRFFAYSCDDESKDAEGMKVEIVTLDHVWNMYVGKRQVDFLRIGLDGADNSALLGADFSRVAPNILVVSGYHLGVSPPAHDQCELMLLDHYDLFYFDDSNRFYARIGFAFDREECIQIKVPEGIPYPKNFLEREIGVQLFEDQSEMIPASEEWMSLRLCETSEPISSYRGNIPQAQPTAEALMAALEEKDRDLLDALDLLLEKDEGLAELSASYDEAQNILLVREEELRQVQWALECKDEALRDAAVSYEALRVEFQSSNEHAELLSASLLAALERCRDIEDAYKDLREQFDGKLSELELAQGMLALMEVRLNHALSSCKEVAPAVESDQHGLQNIEAPREVIDQLLKEAAAYSTSLLDELQKKDAALFDAACAYKSLRDEFDGKLRELEKLHERLSRSPRGGDV